MFAILTIQLLVFLAITWCKECFNTKVLWSQDINLNFLIFICVFVIAKYDKVIHKRPSKIKN